MRPTIRVALVAAAASAVLVGSAATAMADSASVDDKRYDVLVTDGPDSPTTLASKGTYAQRIASSNIDVNNLSVNHGKDFVSIRVNLHRLAVGSQVGGNIRVNGGLDDEFQFFVAPGLEGDIVGAVFPAGGILPLDAEGCFTEASSNRLRGSSKTGADGYVQLYIPRACLGNPSYVRLSAASFYYDGSPVITSMSKLAKAQARIAAEPTDSFYIDPVNPTYYGAGTKDLLRVGQLTPWLARN